MLQPQSDGLEWARKPRSERAWLAVFQCVSESDGRFEGILIEHQNQGRVVNGRPVKRWDYVTQQWVVL